jgi:hypothetical protein
MRLRPFGLPLVYALGLLSSVAAQDGGWINPEESMAAADMPRPT